MKLCIPAFYRACVVVAALIAQPFALAAWSERSLAIDNTTRVYRVYQPASARANAPAVVVLHGGGQSAWKIFDANAGATLRWLTIADREGVVLLVPNGTHRNTGDAKGNQQNWNDLRDDRARAAADDVKFIVRMIEDETKALQLNRQRVYVTGASNGGMMTFRLLIESPQLFAGGAAFIANLPDKLESLQKATLPTPLMIMNGTQDKLIRWDGGTVANDESRGRTSSTVDTVKWWVRSNHAGETGVRTQLASAIANAGCAISLEQFSAKENGAPLWFYTVQNGGHSMPTIAHVTEYSRLVRAMIGEPCRAAEGAELAWDFLKRFERK